jgi:hypothetical protein
MKKPKTKNAGTTPLCARFPGDENPPTVQCQVTELGTTDGAKVTAATDAAGPQVIVQNEKVHLLSRPLADHEAAVELGKRVVQEGTGVYAEWMDLKGDNGIAVNLFAIFGGNFR